MQEKSKDDAMVRIAQGESDHTRYYWNQATPTSDCPNWIARWFLYHKFRYRDGRNRNAVSKASDDRSSHHHHGSSSRSEQDYYQQGSTASGMYNQSGISTLVPLKTFLSPIHLQILRSVPTHMAPTGFPSSGQVSAATVEIQPSFSALVILL